MLEDPSKISQLNIKDFDHIKRITSQVRRTFNVEFERFARSVSLPPRKPLTHCTWFKSRTGPTYGIRENWTRCDILRWMKIISPEPVKMDHWDRVWYQQPDFPKVKFARLPQPYTEPIPRYTPVEQPECLEIRVKRKFRLLKNIPNKEQYIWMNKPPKLDMRDIEEEKEKKKKIEKRPLTVPRDTRLTPKRVSLTGLTGKEFLLARRKMATPKFFPTIKIHKH
ncbi:uncharacterized protein LOC112053707 [Bicyclus anynana]|uniref:Uncharacterized protein LOC112053707 n=1 Tax=Bicyclus anynana TaxID=110368 RepID=A0A6J1NQ73_BICAN|nr:uncharacterized protein LOC112053707 [Bicyclus anynana]